MQQVGAAPLFGFFFSFYSEVIFSAYSVTSASIRRLSALSSSSARFADRSIANSPKSWGSLYFAEINIVMLTICDAVR